MIFENSMTKLKYLPLALLMATFLLPSAAMAQRFGGGPTGPDFPSDDPVLKAIWDEGMENSQVYDLSQYLADVIGPRLTGAPGHLEAVEWAVEQLKGWGA